MIKNRLAELRKTKTKLSQAEFAKNFHVSQNTISQWERGERQICAVQLIKFADYFDVSIDYLVCRCNIEYSENKIHIKNSLSDDEKLIITKIRSISPAHKRVILSLIDSLKNAERMNNNE